MSGKSIIFDNKTIKKSNFHKNKKLFKIDNIDVDKILVSNKEHHGTNKSIKYFIGYNGNDDIRTLCLLLPQMNGYVKCCENNNKIIYFKVIDNKLLKKYTKIWKNISNLVGKELDSEPIYDDSDKYVKKKTKSYGDKVNTNF